MTYSRLPSSTNFASLTGCKLDGFRIWIVGDDRPNSCLGIWSDRIRIRNWGLGAPKIPNSEDAIRETDQLTHGRLTFSWLSSHHAFKSTPANDHVTDRQQQTTDTNAQTGFPGI